MVWHGALHGVLRHIARLQLVASSIFWGRAPKLPTHNLHRRRTEGGLGKGGPLAKAAATKDRLWERVTGPG